MAPAARGAPPPAFEITALTSRFGTGELLIIGGAALVIGVEMLFGWLLFRTSVPDAILLLTVLMAATVVLQRTGRVDVGSRYPTALLLLGVALAFLTVDRLIFDVRGGISGDALILIGDLGTWFGAAAAAAGGFLVSRPGVRPGT